MMENFTEYIWYLLTTPFKRVKKSVNKWYALCKVLGKRFDEAKEDILRSRDEGMVATCCHEMLPVHGSDRRLVRYDGEHPEKFRERIAKYERICILGGTNEGVLLAVQTLGFKNPELKTAKEQCGDTNRWAEFYVILPIDIDSDYPISITLLKKEVRITKEVGAKDNYLLRIQGEIRMEESFLLYRILFVFKIRWYGNITWDGVALWNGGHQWDNHKNNHPIRTVIKMQQFSETRHEAGLTQKYHYRTWSGTSRWDGTKQWDAQIIEEVL